MSNPYTQPSISGYNASPPSDDGTQTTSNQLGWNKHKTKLADPIKTFAEGVDAAALAAFGLVFGAAVLSKSSGYTVTTADRGRFIAVTGTSTITLIAAATAGSGFPLAVLNNGTNTVTVDGNGAETINGSATQTLFPGGFIILNCDGSSWVGLGDYVTTGSFTPNYSQGFSSAPTGAFNYYIRRNIVTMASLAGTGTSDNTGFVIDNVPAAARPVSGFLPEVPVPGMLNSGSDVAAHVAVDPSGTFTFNPVTGTGSWTASGLKGWAGGGTSKIFSYPLRIA